MKNISFSPFPDEVELLLDGFFAVSTDSTIKYASKGAEEILGYTPEELIGKKMLDLVHPDDRHITDSSIQQVMRENGVTDFHNRYIRKDGRVVHLLWSTSWSEKHQLRLGVARNISRLKAAEAMQKTLLAIAEVVHSSSDLPAIYPQLQRILKSQIPELQWSVVLHDSNPAEPIFTSDANESSAPDLPVRDENNEQSLPLNAEEKPLGVLIFNKPLASLSDNQKTLLQFTADQLSIAIQRQQMLDRLQYLALYDPLTDLPNRQLFHDRLLQALTRARREQQGLAVLYLDLDKFKQANDLLGHQAGDGLLRDVAIRICNCVRDADTVVRFGGDEFVVLLDGIENRLQAWTVAEKIRHTLSQTFYWQDQAIDMSASIGVALFPEQGENAEQLISAADNAMYRAKNSGKNCVR